ncbi:ABC transporter permease [Acetobacterium wieringae]|uniref:ABC transporter permease n=1 Tax=Acetobacterium wieringae TaxID=52694 RepID=UPI0026F1DF81|nr:ABC transporter permease [Acetobacterium wieringae]
MAILTVLWEKWIEFKHEWLKITGTAMISPILYLLTFGLGLGMDKVVDGHSYMAFLIPGIIALTTMNASFNAIGMSLNVQRLYEKSFDNVLASPTPLGQYIIGQMIGGSLRGMYAGSLILGIAYIFGAPIQVNLIFFLVMLLNGMAFSALGVMAAIISKTHADISRFSTFVILPMTFIGNTFFPVANMPSLLKSVVQVLPLTHSSSLLRQISYGEPASLASFFIMVVYTIVFMVVALIKINISKNL